MNSAPTARPAAADHSRGRARSVARPDAMVERSVRNRERHCGCELKPTDHWDSGREKTRGQLWRLFVNYIEWVDLVWQLLDAHGQRDRTPFALDVIRALPAVQANARTFDDRRAADPFVCACEDLVALGRLSMDAQHHQLYRCREQSTDASESLGNSPPAAPAPDGPQIQFLIALIQRSEVVRDTRVWLHWCEAAELCQALGWGAAAQVSQLDAAILAPLEQGGLIRSYPAPGAMRFRPTYRGMQWAQQPV